MNIHFDYNGTLINVPITEKQLQEDANEINDFWGDFEVGGIEYQIQIYQSKKEVAIYNYGGINPIAYSKYELTRV